MATTREEQQSIRPCIYCGKSVPPQNINLHIAHHSRNPERCKICGDMVPKGHAEQHFDECFASEVCGNQSENGHSCKGSDHETTSSTEGNSRKRVGTQRGEDPQRGQRSHNFSQKHLLFSAAVASIAVLLGSFVFQRKSDHQSQ